VLLPIHIVALFAHDVTEWPIFRRIERMRKRSGLWYICQHRTRMNAISGFLLFKWHIFVVSKTLHKMCSICFQCVFRWWWFKVSHFDRYTKRLNWPTVFNVYCQPTLGTNSSNLSIHYKRGCSSVLGIMCSGGLDLFSNLLINAATVPHEWLDIQL
jgi:hypothetical protein